MLKLSNVDVTFLTLNRTVIPDHGYVDINSIGSPDEIALLCHTNLVGFLSGVDWFGPDGTRVNDAPGFSSIFWGPWVVRLKRNTLVSASAAGMYSCQIQDGQGKLQTQFVGLYNRSKGGAFSDEINQHGLYTVEPPNKGHFGAEGFVPCREEVPISEFRR